MKLLEIVLALTVLQIKPALAASYQFDMGGENSPVAGGYQRVTPETGVDQPGVEQRHPGQAPHVLDSGAPAKNSEFGWTKRARMAIFRDDPTNPYFGTAESSLEYALYGDAVLSIEENTFEFRVEPGRYGVTAAIGDLSPGEERPGNSIWANGVQVVKDETTDGQVKVFTFPVEATNGKISLRFRADSEQKYVTVMAVTAESLRAGEVCPPSVVIHPPRQPQPADYQRNWARWEALYVADWAKVKEELRNEGVQFEYWAKAAAALRRRQDYRAYFPCPGGPGRWQRIDKLAGGISLARTCAAFQEMGLDGCVSNDSVAAREFPRHGLQYALYTGGERYSHRMDAAAFTSSLLKNEDGSITNREGVLSNSDPRLIAAFQKHLRGEPYAQAAAGAWFLFIDEPVGVWFSGNFGDYSEPAQAAFKCWAVERGLKSLAEKGIPERGRTMDFYQFYRFRLETPAMFVKAFVKDTPVASLDIVPGNGNAGPELMNHSGFWPLAVARLGLSPTTWAYDSAASCKMYAETVRIAEEFGGLPARRQAGKSCVTPPFHVYEHNTPLGVIPLTAACISALNGRVVPFGGIEEPTRAAWMKTMYYSSRLTHATTGLTHAPPLYVWCPESIVYNDLVELRANEAENWKKLWQTLFNANLDYTVTTLLRIPRRAVLLYACVKPVLSEEEFARLRKFVEYGGTLLVAFHGTPERPDGTPIAEWQTLARNSGERVVFLQLSADALRQTVTRLVAERNWETEVKALKTHLYHREKRTGFAAWFLGRGQKRVHLLNNTDIRKTATVTIPSGKRDVFTGKILKKGAALVIPPGQHALLEDLSDP